MDVEMASDRSESEESSERDVYDDPYDEFGRIRRPTSSEMDASDSDAAYPQPSAEDSS